MDAIESITRTLNANGRVKKITNNRTNRCHRFMTLKSPNKEVKNLDSLQKPKLIHKEGNRFCARNCLKTINHPLIVDPILCRFKCDKGNFAEV